MDDSSGNGTHWVAFKADKNNKDFYFDPIGIIPPVEVLEICKNCSYNTKQIQDRDSTACGYFCITIIEWNTRGGNINDFLKCFSNNSKKNDQILHTLLEDLGV
jgi:hypothetical protein